jgi:hypothetical protein
MTVIKGKPSYAFPTHSGNNSDVESSRLGSASASDTESLNNEPFLRNQPFVPPIFKNSKSEEQPILKRCSGRKKLRRYQNRSYNCFTVSAKNILCQYRLLVTNSS